ncbi:unnamed protein product, partial [Ixodes pacificus]
MTAPDEAEPPPAPEPWPRLPCERDCGTGCCGGCASIGIDWGTVMATCVIISPCILTGGITPMAIGIMPPATARKGKGYGGGNMGGMPGMPKGGRWGGKDMSSRSTSRYS